MYISDWKYKPDICTHRPVGLGLKVGPTDKFEETMALSNVIKFIRIYEFNKKTPNALYWHPHTRNKRSGAVSSVYP